MCDEVGARRRGSNSLAGSVPRGHCSRARFSVIWLWSRCAEDDVLSRGCDASSCLSRSVEACCSRAIASSPQEPQLCERTLKGLQTPCSPGTSTGGGAAFSSRVLPDDDNDDVSGRLEDGEGKRTSLEEDFGMVPRLDFTVCGPRLRLYMCVPWAVSKPGV